MLSPSRDLTPTRILDTWKELHHGRTESQKPNSQPETPQVVAPRRTKLPQPKPEEKKPVKPIPAMILQKITVGYREYPVEIPETVFTFFKENAVVPENTLWTKPEHILQTPRCFCSPDSLTEQRPSPITAAVPAVPLRTTGARRSRMRMIWRSQNAAWNAPSNSTLVLLEEECTDNP